MIIHSVAAPWSIERIYEYWRDSTNLESHFGLGYDGRLGQYIGTNTRADANAQANVRAISLESAANLQNSDPWTQEQIDTLVRVMDWAATEHGIPRRKCRSWTDPGFGYHKMFPEWSLGGTDCPGAARTKQFNDIVLPRVIAGDVTGGGTDDMAMTDADVEKVANAVWQKLAKADGVYLAPEDAADYSADVNNPGHYWSGRTVFSDLVRRVRDTEKDAADALAQARTNGSLLSELKAAVARLEARG
jgi:hypothetical protein